MTIRLLLLTGAALGGLTCATTARAATAPGQFTVTATVDPSCSVSATNLDFGHLTTSSFTQNNDTTSTITVTCTSGTTASVDLNPASNTAVPDGTGSLKVDVTHSISYALYQDSARTKHWGSGTTNTRTTDDGSNPIGSGAAQTLTVYGRIPIQPSPPNAGTFTDTVNITVNF